jgi:hypothetical protein
MLRGLPNRLLVALYLLHNARGQSVAFTKLDLMTILDSCWNSCFQQALYKLIDAGLVLELMRVSENKTYYCLTAAGVKQVSERLPIKAAAKTILEIRA